MLQGISKKERERQRQRQRQIETERRNRNKERKKEKKKKERKRKKDIGTKALMEQRRFNQHGVGIYTVLKGGYSQQR